MKVINKYVDSLKELNLVYNRLIKGKHNIFKNKKAVKKVEAVLFPVSMAYVDLIDVKHKFIIHYTIKE